MSALGLFAHMRDLLLAQMFRTLAFEGEGIVREYVGGWADYLRQYNAAVAHNRSLLPAGRSRAAPISVLAAATT